MDDSPSRAEPGDRVARPVPALASARLTDQAGKLYAHAMSSSCLIVRPGG